MRRRVSALLSSLAVLAGVAAAAPPASALDPGKGYTGICTGADALTGVTVVVDFQELDGNGGVAAPTITRCSPNASPGTQRNGVQALQDAGIAVAGTAQWGLGFLCRLENRPSATESIPITTSPGYHEGCVRTPPGTAYWSYWNADGAGTTWTYSSYGAMNRNVVPGGFEGWSFSLNKSASTNPAPRVTPHNPAVNAGNPTVSLSADDLDRTITLGQSTTLTWTSTHASALTASAVSPATGGGAWSGPLAVPGGTKTITPTAKGVYTYTIQATGTGTVYSTATLTVQ
ncbi:ABC transporter substrate-binding protein [Amycolatopsis sp. PS_44_ISF1]|uniref:ABC transporter substrate-binding protein n=1 Tax=Amycolatopsis sp. PS_44_ISF1 TaxID=2974917 RepID=UPI0028DD53E9|nr:ABC transporter substrate-binding protein [Amycolatopsis sp. PS_44_ISF1]MDT8913243.1 ABC transporter substrate-binding protein [Amycolatopsis sp. PS_44_ISF1]